LRVFAPISSPSRDEHCVVPAAFLDRRATDLPLDNRIITYV
jgi:hypothetical protein